MNVYLPSHRATQIVAKHALASLVLKGAGAIKLIEGIETVPVTYSVEFFPREMMVSQFLWLEVRDTAIGLVAIGHRQ